MVFSSLFLTLLLLHAQPVLNFVLNEAGKPLMEHCSRHSKLLPAVRKNSYLWTLEDYPSVYIFGSIHQPFTSVWPHIPRNVKKAFKSSKRIYFEIDLTDPEYYLSVMKCQYLPYGQTLVDVLSASVFNKLQNYLQYIQSQIPDWLNENQIKDKTENSDEVFRVMTKDWEQKRPIWILLQLASFNKESLQSRNIPTLDLYMFNKGQKARKSIGHLESPEERCALNNVNSTQAIIYLDEMLTKYNHASYQPAKSNLTYHYVCGNLSNYLFSSELNIGTSSQTSRLQTIRNFEDSLTKELFLRRNKQMARKIIKEIKFKRKRKNKKIFFTIGAGHLVGKRNIIEILRSKGFKPRHILPTESLRSRQKMNDFAKNNRPKLKLNWRKKKKVVKQSLPTLITSTYLETEHVPDENTAVNVHHWNEHHTDRSFSLNLGLQTGCNILMTFFLSFIHRIVIY